MYRGKEVATRSSLYVVLVNALTLMLACIAMSTLVITSVSAQTRDKAIVVTGPGDAAQSTESTQGKCWALLVGIAKYPSVEGFEIQQLKAPVKDVNALADFLRDSEKSGFDADHVITLTDAEATRRDILLKFNEIAMRAAPEDMVLFYFSGHGVPSSDIETTYLIPYDHDLRDMETTCIDFDDLARKIRRMEASKVVVILDACHSGGVKVEGAKGVDRKCLVERYAKSFQESEGRALLLSSDESEVSWETDEYGIFTHFLLEGLAGKADTDSNGIVTFTEAARYVEDAVPEYTRARFPQVQKPMRRYELGTVRGEIPLAINWNVVRQHRQQEIMSEQQELLDKRNAAIFRAALSGLDGTLKEFSLQVAKSAYLNAVEGEPLKEQDSLLLQEIDALKDEKMAVADYIARARAIYRLAHPLTLLQVISTPEDATVTLAPAEDPNSTVSPSSPNVYEVQAGQYRLSAQRPGYAPYSRELSLAGEGKTLNVALERLMGTLNLRVEPADAKVTLAPISVLAPDNQMVQSQVVPVQTTEQRRLPVGTYQVMAEKEGYERSVRDNIEIKANMDVQVTITLKPTIIIPPEQLQPRSRALMPLFSLVLPGSGQYYGRRYGSGTFFLLTGVGAAVAVAAGYQAYSSSVDEYNEAIRRYNEVLDDPNELESAKQAMLDAEDDADTKFLLRQTALATLVGIWAANVLHAYIAGPSTAASSPYVEADEPGWRIVPRVASNAAEIVVRHPL